MDEYIFIISDRLDKKGSKIKGRDVFGFLMDKKVWGLHPTTQHRSSIKENDRAIFYLSGEGFIGTAKIASSPYIDKSGESDDWWFNRSETNYRVDLSEIDIWDRIKPIQPLLSDLSFIKNKKTKNWGAYLQGGVRKITSNDYQTIIESDLYEQAFLKVKSASETVLSFNPVAADYEPHSFRSPDRIKINRIIDNVQSSWGLPNFQRYFDWSKEDVRSFLESIFNDYYVGTFLLWESTEDPKLAIESIRGVDELSSNRIEYIILDGQQRMTALYYAIKTPHFGLKGSIRKPSYFYLDLRSFLEDVNKEDVVIATETKLSREESYNQMMFPFYELDKLSEWVNGFEDYLENQINENSDSKAQIKDVRRTIEKRLRHVWDGYEIPYVALPKSMDLVHVSNVFENINTKGKPLNTFDLLIARLLKYDIKLKDLWDKACDDYPNIKRYSDSTDKIRMYVFHIMSLLYHPASSCKRKDILNIWEALLINSTEQFNQYWKISIESLDKSIGYLENMRHGFGIRSEKDVAFMPSIPMVAAFLVSIEDTENASNAYEKMHQWYWASAIESTYSSGVETHMTSDFKQVTQWFDDDEVIPSVIKEARNSLEIINLKEIDESSSAPYRAILGLIALEGAKDFATRLNLEAALENNKDHLFPKSPNIGFGKHKNVNSVLNMTWMSDKTNKFIKGAKKPSEYIPTFMKDSFNNNSEAFNKCLSSHIIDNKCIKAMKEDNFDEFLDSRYALIISKLRKKIGSLSNAEVKIADSSNDFIDEIENKVRILIDEKLSSTNDDYWKEFIPEGVKERVKEKIEYHIKKYPSESEKEFTGLDKLHFCDISDYLEIIISRKNWANFESIFVKKSDMEKHFGNLKEYRNCIKHSRPMNNVVRKSGEASLEWIDDLLNYR